MSKNYKDDIYSQISEAHKCNHCFDEFVKVYEKGIESWKDNLIVKNNFPQMLPKLPREPRYTLVSILLPVVPISPNETKLFCQRKLPLSCFSFTASSGKEHGGGPCSCSHISYFEPLF